MRREKDIEQLRKIALVQQSQLERLLEVLAAQSERLDALTGGDGELQRALELLEKTKGTAPSQDDERRARRKKKGKRKKRTDFGATEQPKLQTTEALFELDPADLDRRVTAYTLWGRRLPRIFVAAEGGRDVTLFGAIDVPLTVVRLAPEESL